MRSPHVSEGVPLPRRTLTILSQNAGVGAPLASAGTGRSVGVVDARYKDHGGFPGPVTLTKAGLRRIMPGTYRKLERKMTVPYTMSYNNQVPQSDVRSVTGSLVQEERMFPRWLPAISGLTINRNSDFRTETLSDDELEKIGGTEYRALRLLSYVIPIVCVDMLIHVHRSTEAIQSVSTSSGRSSSRSSYSRHGYPQ